MQIVNEFPHRIRCIENCWIPMSDGCRLAARIWLPVDAETHPVPAILEYIPYRKRDFTRGRDEPMHAYFAGHGYAAVRLDLRGSGDSDGVLLDEYLEQEQDDAVEAIRWIAAQSWCTGAVGMMGKSWGGFNALQVAARRPPALKAVITFCSTDDRYADDVHYMGGCHLAENLEWGSVFFAYLPRPPDPQLVGERWRDMWRERLENVVLPPAIWLRHQCRDAYWKHGSVCEDYSRIDCAVYAVGGWADGYSNAIFRLMAHLDSPRKGLIGPWAHLYAQDGVPGPAIGFLQEAVRWWDHWLKGEANGIMDEPMLRVWRQESMAPARDLAMSKGGWIAESQWPSPSVTTRRFALAPGRLASSPGPDCGLEISSPQTTGLGGPHWCHYGGAVANPGDQRADDGASLVFDSDPLTEEIEILGAPEVALEVAADRPVAMVAVRLNEVMPDGASTRITFGLLNLTHRESHEHPRALEPGHRYAVRVRLNEIAHVFGRGSRIRLAISTCCWPLTWPMPEPITLSLYTGASALELPIRSASAADGDLAPFGEPESAPDLEVTTLVEGRAWERIEHDLNTGETTFTDYDEGGLFGGPRQSRIDDIDLTLSHVYLRRYSIREDDPTSASAEIQETIEIGRDDWQTRIKTRIRLTSTREQWRLQAELDAYEGESRCFSRNWDETIERDHM